MIRVTCSSHQARARRVRSAWRSKAAAISHNVSPFRRNVTDFGEHALLAGVAFAGLPCGVRQTPSRVLETFPRRALNIDMRTCTNGRGPFCSKPLHLELSGFQPESVLARERRTTEALQPALVEVAYRPGRRLRKGCTWRSLITISVAAGSDMINRNPLLK